MKPSPSFVRTLELLDPLLGIHWGESVGKWVIDRKAVVSPVEIEFLVNRLRRLDQWSRDPKRKDHRQIVAKLPQVKEELACAKAGRRVVLFADALTTQVYNALCASDMRHYGGYSRFCDKLEAEEETRHADLERQQSNTRIAQNKDMFDILNFVWRKRETDLLRNERSLSEMVHGPNTKRSVFVELQE